MAAIIPGGGRRASSSLTAVSPSVPHPLIQPHIEKKTQQASRQAEAWRPRRSYPCGRRQTRTSKQDENDERPAPSPPSHGPRAQSNTQSHRPPRSPDKHTTRRTTRRGNNRRRRVSKTNTETTRRTTKRKHTSRKTTSKQRDETQSKTRTRRTTRRRQGKSKQQGGWDRRTRRTKRSLF